jgi:hypothetical protein
VLRSQHRVYDGSGEVARTAKKVMDRLRDDPNENIFKIYGHITVDTKTGEYIGHNLDGTVKFLLLAWAGMPKTSFRKNSDSPHFTYFFVLGLIHC